jgi:hypothetical protein
MHVTVLDKKDGTAAVVIYAGPVGDTSAEVLSRIMRLPVGAERSPGSDQDAIVRSAANDVLGGNGYVTCGEWAQQLGGRTWAVSVLPVPDDLGGRA